MEEILEKLLKKLEGVKKIVFLGIGEEKLSDDGVGPYIISELLYLSNNNFLFLNAGIDPMSRIDEIINFNPSNLVLLDTCNLNKPVGTIAIIERENIQDYVPISTHTIPIHIVMDLLIEKLPDLKIFMIGFVPENLDGFTDLRLYKEDQLSLDEKAENVDLPFFEFHLSEPIKEAADQIIKIIKIVLQRL